MISFLTRFRHLLARRHIVRAHFWQTLANYTQNAGGMVLGIILARLLEPEIFGQFVLIGASLSLLMIPASFSTAQVLVSDGGKTPELFARVMGMAYWVCLAKLGILIAFVAFSWALGKNLQALIAVLIGLPMVLTDWLGVIKSDLEGRGSYYPNFLVQAASLAFQAAVTITLACQGWGIFALALGPLAGLIPEAILYINLTERNLRPTRFNREILASQFQLGFWLWLGSSTANWYSRIDKIFLGLFGGPAQLAFYSRAMNYGPISHILLNSLMTNATIRGLITKGTAREKQRLFGKTALVVLAGGLMNGVFWQLFSDPIVPWIFGEPWRGSVPVFQILGWLGIPYFLLYGSSAVLFAENNFRTIAIIHLTGLIFFAFSIVFLGINNALSAVYTALLFLFIMLCAGSCMALTALLSLKEI